MMNCSPFQRMYTVQVGYISSVAGLVELTVSISIAPMQ